MNCQTLIIHYRYAYVKKNMSRNCLHALPRPCKVNPFVKLSSSKNIKNEEIHNYTPKMYKQFIFQSFLVV